MALRACSKEQGDGSVRQLSHSADESALAFECLPCPPRAPGVTCKLKTGAGHQGPRAVIFVLQLVCRGASGVLQQEWGGHYKGPREHGKGVLLKGSPLNMVGGRVGVGGMEGTRLTVIGNAFSPS